MEAYIRLRSAFQRRSYWGELEKISFIIPSNTKICWVLLVRWTSVGGIYFHVLYLIDYLPYILYNNNNIQYLYSAL